MAAINNFSLVGIGSSVKLGKGGIVLSHDGTNLKVGGSDVALKSFVTGSISDLQLGTMSKESTSDYSKTVDFASVAFTGSTTDDLGEGTSNLYFTDARARAAISVTQNLTYNSSTGVITGPDLSSYLTSASLAGYLQSSDIGTTVQGHDADLDAIAALTGTSGILKKTALNTWTLDTTVYASSTDLSNGLATKEDTITAGTTGQYWRGDKTWQTLDKTAVGLSNVDNTSDADKPISDATQSALDLKAPINNPTFTGTVTLEADPVSALQAATKQYVDGIAAGLTFKAAVRVATTSNVGTYSSGVITGTPTSVDGVTLAAGDRILVKSQTTGLQNGIYVVTTLGDGANGTWSRASDFDEPSEVHGGTFVFVTEGSTLADKGFVLISDNPITLGTDALTWSQYSSTGTVSVAAGTGISVSESFGAYTVSLANVSGVSGSYGAAGKTITLTVDGQGRITAIAATDIAIATSQVTGLDTALAGKATTTEVDAIETAVGLNTDGTLPAFAGNYTTGSTSVIDAINDVDTQVKTNTDAIATKASQTEVDAIETGVGLNTDGTYTAPTGTNYLGATATVKAGLVALDTQVKTNADAIANKADTTYVDDQDALKLNLTGGTMSGNIAMGGNSITGLADPTNDQDAATKHYVNTQIASVTAGGNYTKSAAFTNATTTATIASIPTGATVTRVTVKVTSAFTGGTSPIVTVERGTQVLDDGTGSDVGVVGTYVIESYESIVSGGALTLTVTAGGATAGAGTVFVEYSV